MDEKIIRSWLIRLRSSLERNKVFIDLVVAIALTSMSILVSYNSNQITEQQNELIKEENQPFFVFNLTEIDTADTLEVLEIYNAGKPVSGFSADTYTFLEIYYHDFNNDTIKRAYVPIGNYYTFTRVAESQTGTGLLLTLKRNKHSYEKQAAYDLRKSKILRAIEENFWNYSDDQGKYYNSSAGVNMWASVFTYVHMTYLDIYGEEHDEIYYVDSWSYFELYEKDKIVLENKHKTLDHISYLMYLPPTEIIKILSNTPSDDYILPGSETPSGS